MSDALIEEQTATSIEINRLNDNMEENKEKNNGYDNDNINIKRVDTVFETAMSLKEAFDEDELEMYEATNWRLSIYWVHLWIIYIFFVIGGDNTISIIAIIVYIIDIILHIIVIMLYNYTHVRACCFYCYVCNNQKYLFSALWCFYVITC